MEILNILGINISNISNVELENKINAYLDNDKFNFIVTPNPEFLLQARKDEEFFHILNKADLAIPDGIGLWFAGIASAKLINRITGADLVIKILDIAQHNNKKVVIFNWNKSLSKKESISKALQTKFPNLEFIVEEIDREWSIPRYQQVDIFEPEIALVCLGAPWQEKFIHNHLLEMPFLKLAIGVGGSFDFLTNSIRRAPKIFRTLGFEWFWRIFQEPKGRKLWRLKRIFQAVIVFPLTFLRWKYINPFLYRSNVACILYKVEKNKQKILLLQRAGAKDHWQLPQGGTDNQNLEKAGTRELSEELGTYKFKPIKTYKNLHKYKFGNKKTFDDKTLRRHLYGYKGQQQSLFIAEFHGQDKDIKLNYWDHSNWKWVDSEKLVEEVHEVRKKSAKIYLNKFNEVINK